jgi:hypothetical protein
MRALEVARQYFYRIYEHWDNASDLAICRYCSTQALLADEALKTINELLGEK